MKPVSVACSLTLFFSSISASAATTSCSIQGVWQGFLGKAPVTFEIDAEYGRYHYRESLNDVLLRRRPQSDDTWDEYDSQGKKTGSSKLACNGDTANGTWQSLSGKSAPIALQRSTSYHGDRIKNAPLSVLSQRILSNRKIQLVSIKGADELQTLQITNASPSEVEVNRALRKELEQAVENHLDCVSDGYAAKRSYSDELKTTAVFWVGGILSLSQNYSGDCGGAHPYHNDSSSVFDTQSGTKIQIDSWIVNDQKDDKEVPFNSALGRVIWSIALKGKAKIESLSAQDECLGTLSEPAATIASLDLSGIGFRYWYPHAASGCVEDYIVPWIKLKRFLSPEGQRYFERLQKQ